MRNQNLRPLIMGLNSTDTMVSKDITEFRYDMHPAYS